MKEEKIKCLAALAQESNEHSNTFGTNSTKPIYYPAFCCQDAAATGIPQGLSGQGQAGRTNPIIPARSTGGSSISGYGVSLWGWARPSHNGSLAWWDPWPGINYFSLFCLVKTNPLFYWLLGPKKYISYFPLPFSCFKTPFSSVNFNPLWKRLLKHLAYKFNLFCSIISFFLLPCIQHENLDRALKPSLGKCFLLLFLNMK